VGVCVKVKLAYVLLEHSLNALNCLHLLGILCVVYNIMHEYLGKAARARKLNL
jgi:hypothetical protein